MNTSFMSLMLEKCSFPSDAVEFLNCLAARVTELSLEDELDAAVDFYFDSDRDTGATEERLVILGEKLSASVYSLWLLLFLLAAERAKTLYDNRGVSDNIFFDTFSDLRYKAVECMEEHGVWGTFVAGWYRLFYGCKIIKFGRLEFADARYDRAESYRLGDVVLENRDRVKGIHIPSSGEPFDLEARMSSYRAAYEFYSKETGSDKLCCTCESWLLFPEYEKILSPASNIVSFMHDFDITQSHEKDEFGDDWRLFGKAHRLPISEYPEDTSMRRAVKKFLLEGKRTGEGFGVLIFDGEHILTERR